MEVGYDVAHRALVVPGFMCFAIAQVGGCEVRCTGNEILYPRQPQWLKIEQMSRSFLRRPLFAVFPEQRLSSCWANHFLQPRRSRAADANVWIQLHRKVEPPLKPPRHFVHCTPRI